jgi:Zn-finger protein
MLHKSCKFFPCHKGLEDCKFCYCPIYPCRCDEFGRYIINHDGNRVWDCSNCVVFHKRKIADFISLHGKFKKEIEEDNIETKTYEEDEIEQNVSDK